MEESYKEIDQRISRIESLLAVLILNEIEKKNTQIFAELAVRHLDGFFDRYWINFKKYLGLEKDKPNHMERIHFQVKKVEELFNEFKSASEKLPISKNNS